MQHEIWQQLLALESRDIVSTWFQQIHGRQLNERRSKEITASARQAREFFRNADRADNSVRPLLSFYGIASLARSLTLILRRDGGEECLTKGHGLETLDWSNQLSGELSVSLTALNGLRIRTCAGLFQDLVRQTKNRMPMHVRSSAVDWRFDYDQPTVGNEITFGALTSRIPDLQKEHKVLKVEALYAEINEISYTEKEGATIKVRAADAITFRQSYSDAGYRIEENGDWANLKVAPHTFSSYKPQFMHTYVHKHFGTIPSLFITAPLPCQARYSQLSVTYVLAFFLGMLARYFPTHWVSLAQGNKGDALWPTLNRASSIVENTFPELVAEMLADILSNPSSFQASE